MHEKYDYYRKLKDRSNRNSFLLDLYHNGVALPTPEEQFDEQLFIENRDYNYQYDKNGILDFSLEDAYKKRMD